MQNAGLDDSQVGIKIAGRNINNLSYAGETPLMGESKEELEFWIYEHLIIALNIRTFVGKVMSQLFNTLSRFVIAFLPSKQVSSTFTAAVTFVVILEPKKIQSVIVSTLFPSICHEVTGLDAMVLVF